MSNERVPLAAVLGLGITQNIGYGTLYYSFSILAPSMARDFAVTKEWVFGALSLALLMGGFLAPWLGRLIDKIGAGVVMSVGSTLAAAGLVGCSVSPNSIIFAFTLMLLEVAANLVQYGAAFALLVQINPNTAQRSITYLTLIAGFASTMFWPITSSLDQVLSWHQIYLIFAALHFFVCLPIHVMLARSEKVNRIKRVAGDAMATIKEGLLPPTVRRRAFILLVIGFALQSLIAAGILVHMVPMLGTLGLAGSAAFIGAIFGPAQVTSRFINMVGGANLPPINLTLISATLMGTAILLLIIGAPNIIVAVLFACLFGFGNGLFSIVSGTLPLSLFGSAGYGAMQGKINSARLIIASLAPFAMAFGMQWIGVRISLGVMVAASAFSILAFIKIKTLAGRSIA